MIIIIRFIGISDAILEDVVIFIRIMRREEGEREEGRKEEGGRKEGRRRKEEIYIRIHVLIAKCLESSVPVFLSLIKGHSSMAKFHIARFFHGPRIFSVLDFDRRKKKYNFCIFTFL